MLPKRLRLASLLAAALAPAARAADRPLYAPQGAWVVPVAVPAPAIRVPSRPSQVLLANDQDRLSADGADDFSQTVTRIQTPQGLSDAGAVQIEWNPETETPIIHKLQILRDGKIIDVLRNGPGFTILRRENNLADDVIDGRLTAVVEPEGLRVGDIIDFAYTVHYHDPVLRSHAEALIGSALWSHPQRLFLRVTWPTTMRVSWRETEGLDAPVIAAGPDVSALTIDMRNADPPLTPDGAPRRFRDVGRLGLTDFSTWGDLAALFAPFYDQAATLPANSLVAQQAATIRAQFQDPKARAEAALALVQDKIRYVFLAINGGGYRPAPAELTWQRRFGDCKAKTALLLALLHALDIDAVPALVSTDQGDGLDAKLPAAGWFDHVLVRATIAGQIYWMDGTGAGDRHLDDLVVPPFHFALPLSVGSDALDATGLEPHGLEPLIIPKLSAPEMATTMVIDASGGLFVPAPARVEITMRGQSAKWFKRLGETKSYIAIRSRLGGSLEHQFDLRGVRNLNYRFNEASGIEDVTIEGDVRLDHLPGSPLAGPSIRVHGSQFTDLPDFDREPGPHDDAPFEREFPDWTTLHLTVILPRQGEGFTITPAAFDRTIAGTVLHRAGGVRDRDLSLALSMQTLSAELDANEAKTANAAFAGLEHDYVTVQAPADYVWTAADYEARAAAELTDADELIARGRQHLNYKAYDRAIADMNAALAQRPGAAAAFGIRAIAEFYRGRRDLAQSDAGRAFALDPNDPGMWRCRGLLAQLQGHYAEAVADYTRVLVAEPWNYAALVSRALAYSLLGDRTHQLADYDTILARHPSYAIVTMARWEALCHAGQAAVALKEADARVAADPDNALLHRGRGIILGALGRRQEEIKELDASIALKPTAEAYLDRAQARDAGDMQGAMTDMNLAIGMAANDTHGYMARAHLYARAGRLSEAIKDYSTVISIAPNNAIAYYFRAQAYSASKQADKALADLDTVIAMQPDNSAWLNDRCWMKATIGKNPQSALPDCNAALAKNPKDAAAMDSRGFVYLLLNQLDQSLSDYNVALRLRPTSAESLFGRAIVELRRGRHDAAMKDLAAARKLNPKIDETFASYGIKA
jgi:tetratricopeptide (TPR) repeat protein